jgi:hypothetical protein
MLLAAAMPAQASNWYYVDSASDQANITFIDKDSIKEDGGNLTAFMFSLLDQAEDGAAAYRFMVTFDCRGGRSRLLTGEMYDTARKPHGAEDMGADWETNAPGTQGSTIQNFVCSRGAKAAATDVAGSELPFDRGRVLLDALAANKDK